MQKIFTLAQTLNELESLLNREKFVYIDTETIGLYGSIRLIQLYQSHWDKVLIYDLQQTPLLNELRSLLSQLALVFHNGCYDLACLDIRPVEWHDTFLAGRLHYPHLESFSLDAMLECCLNFNPYYYHNLDKKVMQRSNFSKTLSEEQYQYGAIDVYYMPQLLNEVFEQTETPSYVLDIKSVEYMLQFSKVGLPTSKDTIEAERVKSRQAVDNFTAKHHPLNPNSPKQVKEALGTESSDDKTLAYLISQGSTLAKDVREWRKELKKLNFLDKFDKPRVTGHFNVATRSGRSNCSEENLQQIPSSLKHVFETDKFFVYADFSNLELRTFCAMVGERVMEQMFRDDVDLHSYSAHKLFNTPIEQVTKQQRQIAKTFNFSSLYGAGVAKRLQILLANTGIDLPQSEGERLASEWLRAYPSVREWQQHNAKMWRAGLKGYTALGRPYIAKLYTDFGNLQIQGSGAEVAKLAMHYLFKAGLDTQKLCAFIHDSYTFECNTLEEAKHYAETLAVSMQQAWFEVCSSSSIVRIKDLPMPVLAGVGKNWKKLQGDEDLIWQYELKGLEYKI